MADILSVKNLTVGRKEPSREELVKNISFSLSSGEILGIAGESGSGKTLMACALSSLLPKPLKVLEGEICFLGEKVNTESIRHPGFQRGKDILMLFQSPLNALNPTKTIGAQIAECFDKKRFRNRREIVSEALRHMSAVGLSERCFRAFPHQVSGGQRQRVILAMAFVLKPRLLIADEPTVGLDGERRDQILDLLVRLKNREKTAAIIISHDLRVLSKISDRLMIMYGKQKVEEGRAMDILKTPRHSHTRELVSAMRYLEKGGDKDAC